ncbi:MAG: hypothetical protein L3J82_00290 [Planctomycetes bacterium]|nr:hypothetical protein [Planctomycetota bacterium]
MKILIYTIALALLCSCSSTPGDNIPEIETPEQVDSSTPGSDLYFEKTSLFEVLARRQPKQPLVEEYQEPRYRTPRVVETSRVRRAPEGVLDYGFCLGEGWGVNPESQDRLPDYSSLEAESPEVIYIPNIILKTKSLGYIEGSLEEIIARLAKQAGIDYSIQTGINLGTLKIPDPIEDPLAAIITICRYHGLQIDLSADEVKIYLSRK